MKTVGKLVFTDICDERWMFLSEIIFDGLFQNLLRRIWVLQKKALDNTIVDVLQKVSMSIDRACFKTNNHLRRKPGSTNHFLALFFVFLFHF